MLLLFLLRFDYLVINGNNLPCQLKKVLLNLNTHRHKITCHSFAISIETKSKAVPGRQMFCLPKLGFRYFSIHLAEQTTAVLFISDVLLLLSLLSLPLPREQPLDNLQCRACIACSTIFKVLSFSGKLSSAFTHATLT